MTGLDQYVLRSVSDWRFFFQHAKAEMGIKAINYEQKAVRRTGGVIFVEPSTRQQAAARRHARVEGALKRMWLEDVAFIRLTCDDDPRWQWEPFAPSPGFGNAAHLTRAAVRAYLNSRSTRPLLDWLDRLGEKLIVGRAIMEDRIAREHIRKDIEEQAENVHHRYEGARGRQPR